MRSNLDINLFPDKVKYKLSDELFKVHVYRLFWGSNHEHLNVKFLRKSEKNEKKSIFDKFDWKFDDKSKKSINLK